MSAHRWTETEVKQYICQLADIIMAGQLWRPSYTIYTVSAPCVWLAAAYTEKHKTGLQCSSRIQVYHSGLTDRLAAEGTAN